MSKLLSERIRKTPSSQADPDRYEFINLSNTEPDLGVPEFDNQVLSAFTDGTRMWVDPVGYTGSSGYTGSRGFTGSQGDIGFTGSQGVSIDIRGTVPTVADLPVIDNEPNDAYVVQEDGHMYVWTGFEWIDVGRFRGYTGSRGFTGSQGDIGFTGSQGIIGYTGSQGIIGFTGSRGYTGFIGSQGDVGFTGSKGDIGFTGSQGTTGFIGSQGDVGFTGSKGDIGFTGSRGTTGFIGSQGDVGFTGSKGDIGFTGSRGDTGFNGSQGDTGYTGSLGYTGSQGYRSGFRFKFSTTITDSDPGNGYLQLDNTTPGSVTTIIIDDVDSNGTTIRTDFLSYIATAYYPGYVWIRSANESSSTYFRANIQGTSGALGYFKIIVNTPAGYIFANDEDIVVQFSKTGYTGSKGDTGFTGSKGNIGFTGSRGVTGYTGSKGDTGSSGIVGYTGSQGDVGFTGSKGDVGFTGSKGADGIGSDGSTGFTGSQGDVGFTGSQGNVGYTGSRGDVGFTGSQGNVGFTGSKGADGIGSDGDVGFTGSRGDTGFTGSKGDTGQLAYVSATTPTQSEDGFMWFNTEDGTLNVYYNDSDSSQWITTSGPMGTTGFTGSKGNIGFTGSMGQLAEVSSTAPTLTEPGFMWFNTENATLNVYYVDEDSEQWVTTSGPPGPQGIQGPIGYTGSQGIQGPEGPVGPNVNVAIVSNTTPSTSDAGSIWFDTTDSTFNIYTGTEWVVTSGPEGPEGPPGPQGPQGIQGIQGPEGPAGGDGNDGTVAIVANTSPGSAVAGEIWFDVNDSTLNIYTGTEWVVTSGPEGPQGPQGIQGIDGPSAYEVAVANGFVGTESEWLASLVGPTGFTGSRGEITSQAIAMAIIFSGY